MVNHGDMFWCLAFFSPAKKKHAGDRSVDFNFTELSGSVLQKWNLTWDEFLGEENGTNKAQPDCLGWQKPGFLEAPFFGANCGHKETKNIFKEKHVGNLHSKHPCMMYFPTFTTNKIYKNQAVVTNTHLTNINVIRLKRCIYLTRLRM